MSTRSVIARKTPEGFAGVYHHWDGYPSGVGKKLWELYHLAPFNHNDEGFLQALIDAHPAGWSTICGDWSQNPGFIESLDARVAAEKEGKEAPPACYCHGDRKEEGWVCTHENASGSGCEYAYVFTAPGPSFSMEIYSSVCNPAGRHAGAKMIGAFGCGDPDSVWVKVAVFSMNDIEPDWADLDNRARNACPEFAVA